VHDETLTVRGSHPRRLKIAGRLPNAITPLGNAVCASVALDDEQGIDRVRKGVADEAAKLERRLAEYQLVLDPMRRTVAHVVPIVLFIGLFILGVTKIGIGISRGRPFGYLLALTAVAL